MVKTLTKKVLSSSLAQFLHRLFLQLLRFFRIKRKDPQSAIPSIISENEIIIRGIYRPLFFSGNKLTDKSFLPPPSKMDVSVLRHDYTTSDFCKQHVSQIEIN